MNVFLTSGTMDFMEALQQKFSNEQMIVMHGTRNSILLHETVGKTLFQTPRRYETINSVGILTQAGFFALNNIPVTDEGRPIFEHQFHNHADKISELPGFISLRLLRPLKSDTYIVLTQWSENIFFERWKNSTSYSQLFENNDSDLGTAHIFSSAAYLTTYHGNIEEQ